MVTIAYFICPENVNDGLANLHSLVYTMARNSAVSLRDNGFNGICQMNIYEIPVLFFPAVLSKNKMKNSIVFNLT